MRFGFKRTCFSKGLCKIRMLVMYVREKSKKETKRKKLSITIYDEIKGGRYQFKNKEYDILFKLEGDVIKEERKCLDYRKCVNNIYINANKYIIEKEEFKKLNKDIMDIIKKY